MKNQKGLGLIGVLLIIGVLITTAGGVVVWREKVEPMPVVPDLSEELEALPTATPVTVIPFSGKSGEIQATSSKELYRKGKEVEIQITNNSPQAISYYSGPGCGVSFEHSVKIARPIEDQTPSGTYRAVFQYVDGKAYSSEFQIL